MGKPKTLFIMLTFILCFVLSGIPSLYAQENDEFTLEEITVTAEKRVENVQKTPISLSVITSDEIIDKSLTSVDNILQNIVGLQVQGEGTSAQIFIRGIGLNNLDTAYGDPAIALNVDGIQQQRGGAIGQSTMDVERVEVLRGPQGTLYGRNATGGAVNVIMVQPKNKFESSGRVQLGNYNVRTYEAMLNVPIYSKLALRLSGIKSIRDILYERSSWHRRPGSDDMAREGPVQALRRSHPERNNRIPQGYIQRRRIRFCPDHQP